MSAVISKSGLLLLGTQNGISFRKQTNKQQQQKKRLELFFFKSVNPRTAAQPRQQQQIVESFIKTSRVVERALTENRPPSTHGGDIRVCRHKKVETSERVMLHKRRQHVRSRQSLQETALGVWDLRNPPSNKEALGFTEGSFFGADLAVNCATISVRKSRQRRQWANLETFRCIRCCGKKNQNVAR